MMRSLKALEWPLVQEALANRARSPLGRFLCGQHIPFESPAQSERLRARVAEASVLLGQSLVHGCVSGAQDPSELFERAAMDGLLAPTEIFTCGHLMECIGLVAAELVDVQANKAPLLARDFAPAPRVPPVCERIRRSVSSEGVILDTASGELARLRGQRTDQRAAFESLLDSRIKEWHAGGLLQDKFYDVIDGRYVVPVRVEQQSKLGGILLGKSNTGQSAFIEPAELTGPNNALKELELAVRAEEQRILRELSRAIGGLAPAFAPWVPALAEIDLTFAAAELAKDWALQPPVVPPAASGSALKLEELFHPALKLREVEIVTNSLALQTNGRAVILSGPNTGGKTVLLKAVGLAACMARAGLFVPAASPSAIPHYAFVASFIGDEQNIAQGLSSFSAQILELRALLERPESPMLILVDEILSSTDPEEASALAQAILEEMIARGHHVLVTTHFSELPLRCRPNPSVTVAAMEFEGGRPTYRLRLDELGSSHAIEVAEKLGFPAALLKRARALLSSAKRAYDEAQAALKEKEAALQTEHDRAVSALDRERERLQREHEAKLGESRGTVAEFLRQAQAKLDETVEKLTKRIGTYSKIGASRSAEKKLKDAVLTTVDGLRAAAEAAVPSEPTQAPPPIGPGTEVRVKSLAGARAKVLAITGQGPAATATIQAGAFKVEKPVEDLEAVPAPRSYSPSRPRQTVVVSDALVQVPPKLDVRGMRQDEAIAEVGRYVDQAFRSGIAFVTVVTGHGTGRLKASVRELLMSLPYIREFKPERPQDDGALRIEFER